MNYFGFGDPTYFLVIVAFAITCIASVYMKSTFNKYNQIRSKNGISAYDAASKILINNGLTNVRLDRVAGDLTDHYAPLEKVLRLSDTTYNSTSIASIGVAAHEAGHAVQDATKMPLLTFQMRIVPVVNIASTLSVPIFLVGLLLNIFGLVNIGIILFSATFAYQLITLPIEFDASKRALITLREYNMLDENELEGVKKVLRAAALTYVAAAASTILQLLRFMLIAKNNRRN